MPTADLSTNQQGGWQDWLGITASVACAIHCAVMPFVIGLLPMFGLQFLSHESFHATMAILCFTIAISAFLPGWRQHRRMMPSAIAGAGITLISFAAFAWTIVARRVLPHPARMSMQRTLLPCMKL